MKINDIILEKKDRRDEDEDLYRAPPPGDLGEYITTAQAAKILGVTMSRVRQMIGDGELSAHDPEKGQRDNILELAEVQSLKDKRKEDKKDDKKEKDD